MIIELDHTTASAISGEIARAHLSTGNPAMAFTLVAVTEEKRYKKVLQACLEAGAEHPSRILVVVRSSAQDSHLDAEIRIGEGIPADVVTLRIAGELADHAASVVLPLLLPDSRVVVWWPHDSPERPGDDPIGALATRRITDASGAAEPIAALRVRAQHHSAGDTDLTWTRLTPWRALLAAAVDQFPTRVRSACVEAAKDNAPAELMAAWLQSRLQVPVERRNTRGPGITGVRLTTAAGDIAILRGAGQGTASYLVPGQPKRQVALKRRDLNELITEELRRMDADTIFEEATQVLLRRTATTDPDTAGTTRASGTTRNKD